MSRKHKTILASGLIIMLFLGGLFVPVQTLTILKGSHEAYTFWLKDHTFSIKWTHSVEKEEWVENFNVKKSKVYLESTKFKTFGAGVPTHSEHPVVLKNGWVHMDIDREIGDKLIVRSHPSNDYQLIFDGETYSLEPSRSAYTVTVNRKPVYSVVSAYFKHIRR